MTLIKEKIRKNFRISRLLAVALTMVFLAGCGGGGSATPAPAPAPAPAAPAAPADPAAPAAPAPVELSGKIVIYTSMYEDIIEMLEPVMKRVFPTVNVEFFYGGTGALQAKIAAEIDTGSLGCDMLMVADPSYAIELKEANMLHAYMSPEAGNLGFDSDPEGYWYPVRISNMVLGYNPDRYSKDSIPNSMYDFAFDSGVRGEISKSNPLTSGTALASIVALFDKYGLEYYQALGAQGVMIESGSVALTKLETGECKVIMVLEESILKKREEDGSRLEVIYPTDGTIVIPSPIMTVNDEWSANKNTAAAQAITDWFLSPEGQSYIVAGWMHSVRTDAASPPYDAIPTADIRANQIPVDWIRAYQQREDFRTKFVESVQMP